MLPCGMEWSKSVIKMNEKLCKLSIGSMNNLNNGIYENEERNSMSQAILTPLHKKAIDQDSDHTNRSLNTDRSDNYHSSTQKNNRKLSASKFIGKTSTHRGSGDGPSDEDRSIFIKSARTESTSVSKIDIEGANYKPGDNNFYDDDYEDSHNGSDPDDIENLLELMVAPRKGKSGLIPEQEKSRTMPSSSKSTESLYSNTSSSKGSATVLYRRYAAAPQARSGAFIPATTEVRQRVLSARRLRIKTFQNQLADAQQHIAELAHENRMLRTLHKRQDLALSKYESTNAELPQLLNSHAEEIRVWQLKYRNLQEKNKELLYKLKQKEAQILSLSDQNKHLTQLNKDKNLEERQRLSEKVQQLEMRLQEKETDMKLMARRLQLESKSSRKELQTEQKKRKDAQVQLEKVKSELSGYVKIDELNMNEKLCKLSIGSMNNLNNGIHENEERNSMSQAILTPLHKKAIDQDSDHTNRSLNTDRSDNYHSSTQKNNRKLSASKFIGKTSTHRGSGDGPSDEERSIFIKSARTESTSVSKIDIEGASYKPGDNNFYDDDYEDSHNGSDPDDIENLLEITTKENKTEKIRKPDDMIYIRKELTEDFKQRESFLNTFCRQTTADSTSTNKSSVHRKTSLLAALKAIDGPNPKN